MDDIKSTPPQNNASATGAAPATGFPKSDNPPTRPSNGAPSAPQADGAAANPRDAQDKSPGVDKLLNRLVQGAHDTIDGLADKASAKVDGVGDGVAKITDTKDEWIGAAREAIRERPFAAVGIALLIGVAYASLKSSRD